MISKIAIQEYLERPLRDLNAMKRWSPEKIRKKLASLDPSPTFITEPRHHQKVCFYALAKLPRSLQLLHMGLGKTKLVLDAFRWHKTAGNVNRMLVLVPNVVNLEGWRDEIAKHAPDLSASYVEGSKVERAAAVASDSDLCLSTYSGLTHLACDRIHGREKGSLRISGRLLSVLRRRFDAIVWDESTALINPRSLQFKIASKISRGYKFRVALTGTPLGRDPQVLWPQFFAVDRGDALGPTLGLFRDAFFSATPRYWGGVDYSFKQRKTKDLHRLMAHSSIRYSADECLDLPPKVMVERPVVMSDEAWFYYRALLDQSRAQETGNLLIDIEGLFVRLRQITSGFVSIDGSPSSLRENPKLDALLELVDELPDRSKLVVFNDFVWSGNQIEAAIKAKGIDYARLYSGTRDKKNELRRFVGDAGCRIFIVNSQSGAQGLNLQGNCNFVAFYESPVSPIVRQQAEARVWRQGQAEKVFIYDLFVRDTVDARILSFLREGKDLFKALVDGSVSLLGA